MNKPELIAEIGWNHQGDMSIYLPSIKVNHFFTSNGATWKGIG